MSGLPPPRLVRHEAGSDANSTYGALSGELTGDEASGIWAAVCPFEANISQLEGSSAAWNRNIKEVNGAFMSPPIENN